MDFDNVEINKPGPGNVFVGVDDILRVNGTLTLTDGLISAGGNFGTGGIVEALGDVSIASTFDGGNGFLTFGGNATRTVTIPAPFSMPKLTVNASNMTINTSGTGTISWQSLTLQNVSSMTNGAAAFSFSGAYTQSGGIFNSGGGLLAFGSTFALSGGTFNAGNGNLSITNAFTQTDGIFNAESRNITVGSAFTQSGGTFTGGTGTLDFNNNFTVSGGSFAASSGISSFAANFTVSSPGTFNANGGTVIFDTLNAGFDITPNGALDFNNFELNRSSSFNALSISSGDTIRVNGALTLTNGQISGTGTLEALGNVSIATTFAGGGGNLLIGGNATRTITIPTPASLPNLTVNAPNVDIDTSGNGTVNFASKTIIQNVNSMTNGAATFAFGPTDQYEQSGGTFNVGSGNITFGSLFTLSGGTFTGSSSTLQFNNVFTVSGGTFTASSGNTNFIQNFNVNGTGVFEHNNGTARFVSSTGTVNVINSQDFNNVEIDKSSNFVALGLGADDVMRIRGNLTLTNGQISTSFGNARFEAYGDVTISPTFAGGSGNLHYVGTNNQTYTNNGGNNPLSVFRVDKPSGILTAATSIILPANTGMVINSGTLYLADGSNLSTGGATTIFGNGRLVSDSSTTITLGGNLSNGGVVDLRGGGTCPASDTILIRSSNGTQRSWTGLGTNRLVNVDVQSMGGTGTKTVFSGTDSGNNNTSWVFDSGCPTGLTLSPLTASVQTGNTQNFTASGGFSPYTYSIFTNNSGGSINPASGLYTAGTTAGRTDTIRVTDSFGDTTDATVNTFGAAFKLIYTVQPTNTTAGQNISAIQVAVQDQFGNTVANSNASVTLSIANNPNSGTLSGTATKNAVNGIATFSDLNINRAGNGYTLQAVSSGLNSATSNAFDINFGAATQLAFSVQPFDANPTSTISPPIQVAILDAVGNTVTTANDSLTITIANNPNSGTLSGTLNKNASNGIAIFDDLSINNAGNGYTLSVSSGILSGATSNAFNIANPFVVTNTDDSGAGSLRQAILAANATAGQQTITFNISGTAPFIISPTSVLPDITDSVILDATTQTGFAGTPIVVLTGTNISFGNGFTLRTGSNTIKGFVISQFSIGIRIFNSSNGNVIQGNYIGTVSNGLAANPNEMGIQIFGSNNNLIGGNSPSERNLISGNSRQGIWATSGGLLNNQIRGNYIGTNAAGTSPIPNNQGILISNIGNSITGNLISGNTLEGISLVASNGATNSTNQNQIQGNLIGTKADGSTALPNGVGISVRRSSNIIGGVLAGEANTIAFNTHRGIIGQTASVNNTIRGNSIHSNGSRDIDYGGTFNDANDPDLGFNKQQNYPVLTSSVASIGNTQITGSLSSTPSQSFTLDFYSNPACDASGFGAGQTYLGSTNITTDAGGLKGFTLNLPFAVSVGSFVTSTATDADGNTSEFSACQLTSSGVVIISGTILDTNGNTLRTSQVKETITTRGRITIPDSQGRYQFRNLPIGRDFNIVGSERNFLFSPPSIMFTNLQTSQSEQNFTGSNSGGRISGQITIPRGDANVPVENVTVNLTGALTRTTTTDKFGNYAFEALTPNGSFTVTPQKNNFNFSPSSVSIGTLDSDKIVNFSGATTLEGTGRIVYRSKNAKSILAMNGDGTGKTLLFTMTNGGSVSSPSFSPDGRRIVFTKTISTTSSTITTLSLMDFDGANPTDLPTRANHPRFSPDGTKIIFTSRNRDQLQQVNADGSGSTTIFTSSNSTPILKPDISPDGSKIVFEQAAKIWLINSNGTNLTELTPSGFNSHPRFSPDGTKIAFLKRPNRDPFGDIFTMSLDGSNQTEITNDTEFITFSWSPDGTKFGLDSVNFPPTTPFFHKQEIAPPQFVEEVTNDVFESDWNGEFAVATPTGTSVTNNFGAVELTFSGVSGGGQTTVTPIESRTLTDFSNTFVLNGQAYEISTTASVTPPITVCFTIQQRVTLSQFNNMNILHGENGRLEDRTISRNFATKVICASVSSLSPFVLAEEIDTNLPSISGLILDNNGNPLSGVAVGLTGTEERQTQTNSDGSFKFVNLTANGNYNVSPKQVGYLFNEYNINFIDLTGEETVFFEGILNNFLISGRVADNMGVGTPNVTVDLNGSAEGSVQTDSNGDYAFANLPADGFYIVSATSEVITFSPESLSVDALTGNFSGFDFQSFAPTAANVSVGGKAVSVNGQGILRAQVSLTDQNGITRSVATNQFGYFRFDDIEAGGSYILSIAAKGFVFDDATRIIFVSSDLTDIVFSGTER